MSAANLENAVSPRRRGSSRHGAAILAPVIALCIFYALPAHADGENQFFGTLTGALGGGIVGNQFGHGNGKVAATAAGVVAGGWVGNDIGYSLDNDRRTPAPSGGPRILPSGGDTPILNAPYTPNYVAPDDE